MSLEVTMISKFYESPRNSKSQGCIFLATALGISPLNLFFNSNNSPTEFQHTINDCDINANPGKILIGKNKRPAQILLRCMQHDEPQSEPVFLRCQPRRVQRATNEVTEKNAASDPAITDQPDTGSTQAERNGDATQREGEEGTQSRVTVQADNSINDNGQQTSLTYQSRPASITPSQRKSFVGWFRSLFRKSRPASSKSIFGQLLSCFKNTQHNRQNLQQNLKLEAIRELIPALERYLESRRVDRELIQEPRGIQDGMNSLLLYLNNPRIWQDNGCRYIETLGKIQTELRNYTSKLDLPPSYESIAPPSFEEATGLPPSYSEVLKQSLAKDVSPFPQKMERDRIIQVIRDMIELEKKQNARRQQNLGKANCFTKKIRNIKNNLRKAFSSKN